MKLKADGKRAVDNPSSDQVQFAVYSMTPAGPTFLILSRSRFSYLQVAIVASDRIPTRIPGRGRQGALPKRPGRFPSR
jgi:hypothetical protein